MKLYQLIRRVRSAEMEFIVEPKRNKNLKGMQECFRIMNVEGKEGEIYVPACVQFKIRNFTDINFQNLVAQVNGVLCVNFLVFTDNKELQTFICDRLYYNPKEQQIIAKNRRKKMDRQAFNYVPIMFNKDDNIKIPTTRTKQFQIQSFKTDIVYHKGDVKVKGKRILHTLRKQYNIQIIKNSLWQNFIAPFDFIKLQLVLTLDHMDVAKFQFDEKDEKEKTYIIQQDYYMKKRYSGNHTISNIKKIHFNCLRIEDPFIMKNLERDQRTLMMSPMIAYSSEEPYGKYDVVENQLQSYTHDERELEEEESEELFKKQLFQDLEPTQLHFKPFKYAVFKIPLFRYPVVDMMTIFIPLWLLSFVSVYIYFQTAEIMNRIVNVAGIMIAYAAIQPIVRENLPQATTITLVDILIYSNLLINILFLCKSISIRDLSDDPPSVLLPIELTNSGYNRWNDGLFLGSLAISILNVLIVTILILNYLWHRDEYKAKKLPRKGFSVSDQQNWTLTLLMERAFARYKENLIFIK